MPLYEYACPGCSEHFEALARSWTDRASCPRCGSGDVERLLSTFATSNGTAAGPRLGPPAMSSGGRCCGGGCGSSH
jgi:putative FmdB family regulatory protein